MNSLIISGIKMYRKLPIYLTIQKPYYVDRLSVTSFAATLKPNVFDGSNYKRWKQRVTHLLTTMSIMHVIQGKPEQFSPEEEKAFEEADNLLLTPKIGTGESLICGPNLVTNPV
jgi:ABC-type lipopolysaccharide export system ATPase subunit